MLISYYSLKRINWFQNVSATRKTILYFQILYTLYNENAKDCIGLEVEKPITVLTKVREKVQKNCIRIMCIIFQYRF